MAASTKSAVAAVLLATVLVALVASAAAVRVREDDVVLGSLSPAPAPAQGAAAPGLAGSAPVAWAVATVVSLIAFLDH